MQKVSKKNRLFIYLSILLVVGFGLTSLLSYQVSRTAIHDGIVRNQLPLVGDNVYSEIQRDLLRPVFISSVMAQDAFLRDWVLDGEPNEMQIRRFLKEIKDRYKTVSSFFVSDRTGNYYHPSGVLKRIDPKNTADAWYYRVKEMPTPYEINVDLDAANENAMTIFVNYKMTDYDGKFIGATGVGLTVNAVGSLIARYQNRFQRRIYFVDKGGDIVLPQNPAVDKRNNIRQSVGLSHHANTILSQKTTVFQYQKDGNTNFVSTRFIEELNWTLIVEQSDAEAVGELKNTLMINLGISLLVTIVVLVLTLAAINTYNKALLAAANTEKNTNNRLMRLNRQKDKLLAIIGHDLRSPFTAFLGIAEILKTKSAQLEPSEVSKYADDVMTAGRKAYGVLDSLLEWAHVQWEDLKPEPVNLDAEDLVAANIDVFKTVAESKKILLEWHRNGSAPVYVDKNMIDLVIRNLIDNAIKFTSDGGTITMGVSHESTLVWISVKDTGTGIDPDRLNSLLGPDHIPSQTGTHGEIGIGMGLSLCKEMIEVNGGELIITSELGTGSEFRFSLPKA